MTTTLVLSSFSPSSSTYLAVTPILLLDSSQGSVDVLAATHPGGLHERGERVGQRGERTAMALLIEVSPRSLANCSL